jgi:hypothetical protein
MNRESKLALQCGAKLRQIITDIVDKIEFADVTTDAEDYAPGLRRLQLESSLRAIRELLEANGLYERVYPMDPEDGEPLRNACQRIFGIWITSDVFDGINKTKG